MCEFQESNCNGFGDMWWTDKCTYFSSIDVSICSAFRMFAVTRSVPAAFPLFISLIAAFTSSPVAVQLEPLALRR